MTTASDALKKLKDGQCRFPIGDPRDEQFGFCCLPATRGSYCKTHYRICFHPLETRKKGRPVKSVFRMIENGVLEAE